MFPIIFPAKIRLLSVGVRSRPRIEFPSFSRANERLRPNTPAKVKEIQSIAGAAKGIISAEKSKAKLKITMIKRAKVNIDAKSSFVLSSVIISFQTIAQIFFIFSHRDHREILLIPSMSLFSPKFISNARFKPVSLRYEST